MISPGAIGAGPIVRPFYNRGGASAPAPIARTALGTVAEGTADPTPTIPGITVAAGQAMLAMIAYNNPILGTTLVVDVGGLGLTVTQVPLVFGLTADTLTLCYIEAGIAPYSGDLTFDFSTGMDIPQRAVAYAIKVDGLKVTGALDKSKTNINANIASGTQDSTASAAIVQAKEFIWGNIGTASAAVGDAVGAWQFGLTAGQVAVVSGLGIKEGFAIVNAVATYRAEVTGATSRRYGARVDTWKGL